jgi:hypothetical protein
MIRGASANFALTVKASAAGKVVVLAAAASQNPGPHPLPRTSRLHRPMPPWQPAPMVHPRQGQTASLAGEVP